MHGELEETGVTEGTETASADVGQVLARLRDAYGDMAKIMGSSRRLVTIDLRKSRRDHESSQHDDHGYTRVVYEDVAAQIMVSRGSWTIVRMSGFELIFDRETFDEVEAFLSPREAAPIIRETIGAVHRLSTPSTWVGMMAEMMVAIRTSYANGTLHGAESKVDEIRQALGIRPVERHDPDA